ncbi:hypothetical protein [Aureimonas sp. SK2]|uniref:hypothetical protein n=1 Tax=Aureimonas sp. SK2 TaxID=3015992 RepID=UPI0024444A70|nr:hypothetical protein [Aureimonas sp. SK2]
MQSLRIALGLLALVTTFFLLVPVEPTLIAGRSAPSEPAVAMPEAAPEPPAVAASAEPAPGTPVRRVGPAAVETTALTRLPAAASGAATPPQAMEPEAPAATAPQATQEAAAAEKPAGPDYRMFARPIAVDARTLKTGEITLLVAGVEPVASDARCADGAQAWPCATRARTALRGWIRGRSVLCAVPPEAAGAREITAPCLLGEEDVGEWVVRNGWAHAAPGSRYEAAEREAREARRGVWAYGMAEEASARSGG